MYCYGFNDSKLYDATLYSLLCEQNKIRTYFYVYVNCLPK